MRFWKENEGYWLNPLMVETVFRSSESLTIVGFSDGEIHVYRPADEVVRELEKCANASLETIWLGDQAEVKR